MGNARIAGLQADLKMTNVQYSIALTLTYVPYIAAELPSNLMLKVYNCKPLIPLDMFVLIFVRLANVRR